MKAAWRNSAFLNRDGTKRSLRTPIVDDKSPVPTMDFESLVNAYYQPLYRFAFTLTRNDSEACDLTQQTFYIWAVRGWQLRDRAKVKTWLFTTLRREFLQSRRKLDRFPEQALADCDLPLVESRTILDLDIDAVLEALSHLPGDYRTAVSLFYLEELSYKEIAEIVDVPIGTVQSRIARGKAKLYQLLSDKHDG